MTASMTFSFFIFLLLTPFSNALEIKPTLFQQNIKQCLKDKIAVTQIKNLEDLYRVLDKAFPLRTNETVDREIVFKEKGELKKLKVAKGKISIYRVLPDQTISLVNNDARQKGRTEESAINQLLVRADIQSDWLNVLETRSGQATLLYGRQQGQIKSLNFAIIKDKVNLECSNIELSDICLCRP